MRKNIVEPDNTADAFSMPANYGKNTDTHSEYVILIACPLQQWLNQRTLVLRCMYFASLIVLCNKNVTEI